MAADSAFRWGGDAALTTAALAALNVAEREACGNPLVDTATVNRVSMAATRAREAWDELTPHFKEVLLLRLLAAVPATRDATGLAPKHASAFTQSLASLCEQHSMRCVDDATLTAGARSLYMS